MSTRGEGSIFCLRVSGGRLCFAAKGFGWGHFLRASASGRRYREIVKPCGYKDMSADRSVTYSLDYSDFKAFSQRVLALAKARQKAKSIFIGVIHWLVLLAVFILIFRMGGDDVKTASILPGFLVAVVVISAFIVSVLRDTRLMRPDASGHLLGERTLTVSEVGFEVRGQHYGTQWEWSGVILLDETKQYLFLFLGNNAGHIIPQRIFSSIEKYREFRDTIADFHRQGSANCLTS